MHWPIAGSKSDAILNVEDSPGLSLGFDRGAASEEKIRPSLKAVPSRA